MAETVSSSMMPCLGGVRNYAVPFTHDNTYRVLPAQQCQLCGRDQGLDNVMSRIGGTDLFYKSVPHKQL